MLWAENVKKRKKIEQMADFHGKQEVRAVLPSLQGWGLSAAQETFCQDVN